MISFVKNLNYPNQRYKSYITSLKAVMVGKSLIYTVLDIDRILRFVFYDKILQIYGQILKKCVFVCVCVCVCVCGVTTPPHTHTSTHTHTHIHPLDKPLRNSEKYTNGGFLYGRWLEKLYSIHD